MDDLHWKGRHCIMNKQGLTIKEAALQLEACRNDACQHDALRAALACDERQGIQRILEREQRYLRKCAAEKRHMEEMLETELAYHAQGYRYIAGVDEVGRGPLAGPVVAASVILPLDFSANRLLDDSKKLKAEVRDQLFERILGEALAIGLGLRTPAEIDRDNILVSSLAAMKDAVNNLEIAADLVLVDGNQKIPILNIKQHVIIGGDAKVRVISAASIVAKVVRDRLMTYFDGLYPQYLFARNKGYPTAEHRAALLLNGSTPLHRLSFLKGLHE